MKRILFALGILILSNFAFAQSHVKTLLKRYGYIADDHEFQFGYDFNYFLHGDKIYKRKY